MTIGKNSRKSSVRSSIRAPKFLDKASGFYGRLDEPEAATEEEEEVKGKEVGENGVDKGNSEAGVVSSQSQTVAHSSGAEEREEAEAFDFAEGMMEDDGETLLRRKSSRRSSRWRRSSRRKLKEEKARDERPSLGTGSPGDAHVLEDIRVKTEVETEKDNEEGGGGKGPVLVHFQIREDADDQVLIRDKKREREEEGKEERKMKREEEEGVKVVKRNTVKTYRKAFDQAFRRGWEAFITNLYSVTLIPVTSSSSSPASKKKHQHNSVLAEFQ